MFLFSTPYHQVRPSSYSTYDYPHLDREYLYGLARQRARERRELYHQPHLEAARRQRAYQEQLPRENAVRRLNYLYFSDYDDDVHDGFVYARQPREKTLVDLGAKRGRTLRDAARRELDEDMSGGNMGVPQRSVHIATPATKSQAEQRNEKTLEPSRQAEIRDAAARKLQTFIRTHLRRLRALREIDAVEDQFAEARGKFQFPSELDFDPTSNAESSTPSLLFTPRNAPLHRHEHAMVKLLSDLDAVESHGDDRVRNRRRELVKRIERALTDLDARKVEMWRATRENDPRGEARNSGYASEVCTDAALPPPSGSSPMLLDAKLADLAEDVEEEMSVERDLSISPEKTIAKEICSAEKETSLEKEDLMDQEGRTQLQ